MKNRTFLSVTAVALLTAGCQEPPSGGEPEFMFDAAAHFNSVLSLLPTDTRIDATCSGSSHTVETGPDDGYGRPKYIAIGSITLYSGSAQLNGIAPESASFSVQQVIADFSRHDVTCTPNNTDHAPSISQTVSPEAYQSLKEMLAHSLG